MKTQHAFILSAALLAACGDKGTTSTDSATGTTEPEPSTTEPQPGTTTEPQPGTTETTGVPTTGAPTTTDPTTDEPTTTMGEDPFVFDDTPPEQMVQLDRMGMPAIATAVISADMKDAYNEASPFIDAMDTFVPDIVANVIGLHTALDDDLVGAGLVPCEPNLCAAQAAPLVIPDTLKIDVSQPAGFPNGRRLQDPVVDITLAVVLLDLTVPGQTAASLASLPLNPPENDKPFLTDFPYVAEPH
jgi:hypothetical protein